MGIQRWAWTASGMVLDGDGALVPYSDHRAEVEGLSATLAARDRWIEELEEALHQTAGAFAVTMTRATTAESRAARAEELLLECMPSVERDLENSELVKHRALYRRILDEIDAALDAARKEG